MPVPLDFVRFRVRFEEASGEVAIGKGSMTCYIGSVSSPCGCGNETMLLSTGTKLIRERAVNTTGEYITEEPDAIVSHVRICLGAFR